MNDVVAEVEESRRGAMAVSYTHLDVYKRQTLLHGQDLGQRLFTLFLGVGEDHLTHGSNTIRFKEHMLGTAQALSLIHI